MSEARFQSVIAGEPAGGGRESVDENPSDLDAPVGTAVQAGADLVGAAVEAAVEGGVRWRATTSAERAAVLEAAASELLARADQLGRLLALEEGKTLAGGPRRGRPGRPDLPLLLRARRSASAASWSTRCGRGSRSRYGGSRSAWWRRSRRGTSRSRSRPGRWPRRSPTATGVVLKPADWCRPARPSWSASSPGRRPGGRLQPAGRPRQRDRRRARLASPGGRLRSAFTGSVEVVGGRVVERPPAAGARVQLEMGGKNPLVVLDDADLEVAVECAAQGAFFQTGQRCTASSRLIVDRRRPRRVRRAPARADRRAAGGPRRWTTASTSGRSSTAASSTRTSSTCGSVARRARELVTGGELVDGSPRGWFLRRRCSRARTTGCGSAARRSSARSRR